MNAELQALMQRFEADPTNARAFEALEEAHFVGGAWADLVALYDRRLAAPDLDAGRNPGARARLLLRLGQVLEERCLQPEAALERYEGAIALEPTLRPALTQLRHIHAAAQNWEAVLDAARREVELPMRAAERAGLQTELAAVYRDGLDDPEAARRHYELALEASAEHVPALLALAELQRQAGAPHEARKLLERASDQLYGADRAPVLLRMARLAARELADPAGADALYRRALTDDPRSSEALEAVAEAYARAEQWALYDELQERRFALTERMLERLAIAHDAGRVHLEEIRNPQGARHWFRRAEELFPDDPVVHLYLADVERLSGNHDALADHLKRATELADDAAPVDALRESAQLEQSRGEENVAIEQLRRALEREPRDEGLYQELAGLLQRSDRDDELVALLESWLATAPEGSEESAALWARLGAVHDERTGDEEGALQSWERAAAITPAEPAVVAALGRLHRKREDWTALRAHLERALAAVGDEPERAVPLYVELGDLWIQLQDIDAAMACFRSALQIDGDDAAARQGLERVALATGDDEAIMEAFEREVAVTTDRGRLAFLVDELSRIHEERDEPERALEHVLRLVAVTPEDRGVLEHCARLQQQLGLPADLAATLEALDFLLHGEERAANRRRLGALYVSQGQGERGLASYRAALVASPDDIDCVRALVSLLEDTDRHDEQIDAWRHLAMLVRGEERSATLVNLGALLMEHQGDLEGAATAYESAIAEGDAPARAETELIRCLEGLGRFDAVCVRLAEKRRRLDPLDPEAFELDLRRAEILLDELDRADEAVELFDAAIETDADSERARSGLEKALRRAGNDTRLVDLLAQNADRESDEQARAWLQFERAQLLEDRLLQLPEARGVLTDLAEGSSDVADEAEQRLRTLLDREGDWVALFGRIERRLGSDDAGDAAIHRELAALARDRLRDVAGAIAHLEEAAALEPGRIETWQTLAAMHGDAGHEADVFRCLEAELATEPDDDRRRHLHTRAAEIAQAREDTDHAEEHYRALLALDPSAAAAVAFLADLYESSERHAELAALLAERLAGAPDTAPESEVSLRLRLAALQAGPLEAIEDAIATLAPAAERDDIVALVAEPLADLYQRQGSLEPLVALARRAAIYAELPGERASWHLRVGDTLRAAERDAEAGDAYRQALAERPDDRSTEAALRDIHRRLEEHEPLARLLEAELARVGGNAELPLRRELATLCAGTLARPADALGHLRRILEIAPREAETLEEAVRLAEATGAHAEAAELMDRAARQAQHSERRAGWMTRRGRVLADTLGRDEEAAACFEAALTLVPGQIEARRGLRSTLEARGDWLGVLESYERELDGIPVEQNDRRQALIEEAAQLAAEHIGESAALPWLARQRDLCPDDANLLRRIAALHRNAGRHAALLGTIEDQLELGPAREARIALEVERARLLEEAFGAPARAAAALEEARSALPDAPEILVALDALYEALGRPRDRRRIVEARLGGASKEEVLGLRATAATLCEQLAEPSAAADHLFAALSSGLPSKAMRSGLLRDLAAQLERLGRSDLWARVAEEELASLDPEAGVFTDRLLVLHERLHRAHEADGDLDAALRHGRALLAMELPDAQRDETERRVLDLLRRMHDAASLAALLATRLARRAEANPDDATDADAWLELARLRAETMQRPGPAAAAFREVLARRPEDLDALRGLRSVSERLGHFDEVASALENEIALRPDAAPSERAALHRRLGDVAWHELDATTRASRAFAGALEADPGDLEALRSLQQLFETMEDWRGAADLYESEVTALGDEETERRQAAWLRAGEIARDHLDDATRALRHFEAAADASSLPTERQAEWAELYDSAGNVERFVDIFGGWLEAVGGSAAADQLRQAEALKTLGRLDDAIRHALQATEIEAASPAAWDALAALHDAKQEPSAAAAALDHAARLQRGTAAAQRHLAAAERLGEGEDTRTASWLEDAVAADPALVTAHARLAVVASRLGCLPQAERAAEQVLAAEGTTGPNDELRFDALFAGARAARAQEHLQEAARMLDAAGALMPEHPEVLGVQGRVLSDLGDAAGAREALQRLLAVAPASADRAAHLTLLASAEESLGDSGAALARFREAVAADTALDDAHAGLTRSLVQEGEIEEAVGAFIAWAELGEGSQRGARLLQAAELELGQADTDRAEGLLRDALDADPTLGSGWRATAELLASQGRDTELIELSDAAFATDLDATDHARIALLRGRALEQRGDAGDAAEAFAGAAEHDPRCAEGALSAARLRRGLGSWQDAAAVLERFVERAPADAGSLIAPALHQLGRLRAGPLEDVEGAVAVYRRALEADPELREAKEALADLLVHRPKAWDEAITRHRTLLAEHPTRLASLRALLRIARGRANEPATATGLALLRALGSATPDERIEAPARPPIELARRPRLATEVGEAVRRMAQETASEIGEALGVGTPSQPEDAASDPIARFRHRVTTAAGALAAAALVPLPLEEVGAVLRLTAELGHEQEGVTGDGHLVNALSSSLTRRARRRIRKALGSVTASEVAALDVAAWRADLAAVAGAAVIDAGEADLRTAFLAWIGNDASSAAAIPPESDIREAVAASPEARAFLWRAVEAWHESL